MIFLITLNESVLYKQEDYFEMGEKAGYGRKYYWSLTTPKTLKNHIILSYSLFSAF